MKCPLCKCKIPLILEISNKCRCGNTYCAAHRLPEAHACTVEYREAGKDLLRRQLIKVNNDKIIKI